MNAPRLDIDLDKIHHNARTLVERLAERDIAVTGVTKATLGSPEIARVLLRAGVTGLGDARIDNLEALRRAGVPASMTLIRSPMLSQVARVVEHADVSCNTELDVITALSSAAQASGRSHGILLMVELGDLREGIMPGDLESMVGATLSLANLTLAGIGTNLACQSGVAPSVANMAELSALAVAVEAKFDLSLERVSGGNSANIAWALSGAPTGRVNDLRLGEAILLGRDPLDRQPIEGLHTDAFALVAEVIEAKVKPSLPWGETAESAYGTPPPPGLERGDRGRSILAVGEQDVDPSGLEPPSGVNVLGASSDHLVVDAGHRHLRVGSELTFQLNYSALVRAMTSPFVTKAIRVRSGRPPRPPGGGPTR